MYDGDRATLAMKHYLREEREMDTKVYSCTVIEYKKETEQVHLLLISEGNLTLSCILLVTAIAFQIIALILAFVRRGQLMKRIHSMARSIR